MHQDRVADHDRDEGDGNHFLGPAGFLALAGVDDRQAVVEQPHHPNRDGLVGAGDADLVVALGHDRVALDWGTAGG